MTALKWITTEAKKIKKAYPNRFAKWTDYVAQASAIYAKKHGGKSPVGKPKKVGDYKINKGEFVEANKPTTPRKKKAAKKKVWSVTRTPSGRFKKKGIKRVAGTTHKDAKSHNVNIRVVSGIKKSNDFYLKLLSNISKEKTEMQILKDLLQQKIKLPENKSLRTHYRSQLNAINKTLLNLKKQHTQVKKLLR